MAREFNIIRHIHNDGCPLSITIFGLVKVGMFGEISFAYSICGEDDMFCRSVGRELAGQRFNDGELIKIAYQDDLTILDNIYLWLLGKDALPNNQHKRLLNSFTKAGYTPTTTILR